MKLFSIVSVLFILSNLGCRKASTEIPSYLKCDSAVLVSTNYGEPNSNIYGLQINLGADNRGTWQMPFLMPILKEGNQNIVISPVVKINNLSTLFTIYPFYKTKSNYINLTSGVKLDSVFKFEYIDSLNNLMQEDFEFNTNFNTPATRSTNARNGNYSLSLAIDNTTGDSSITVFYSKTIQAKLQSPIYMEFDFKMSKGILEPALAYTDINGNVQISLGQSYLTSVNGWTHVYWDLSTQVNRSFDGRVTPVFILITAKGETTASALIDNIRILQK